MSVLNKNNYGYISPSDFNLFAKQAQLDLFENYFYSYNYQINKENARASGTGYADITKGLEEVIDTFSRQVPLLNNGGYNEYFLPSLTTTNDDYYLINKNLVYNKILIQGTTTGTNGGSVGVFDSTADFIAAGVQVGDIASTVTGGITYNTVVASILSATQLIVRITPGATVWNSFPKDYIIYSASDVKEAEKVTQSKITMLNNSILTAPNLTYPAYIQNGLLGDLFPNTINNVGQVVCQYIRFPYIPKWTFVTLTNGEPAFDESQESS